MLKATVSKQVLIALHVGLLPVTLNETLLVDAQRFLGGTLGMQGDASESLRWLCLTGNDSGGRWALWLETFEISGGTIGGYLWRYIPADALVDQRCTQLKNGTVVIGPPSLRLRDPAGNVRKVLGEPTVVRGKTLFYLHEEKEMLSGEEFYVENCAFVTVHGGVIEEIEVFKTESN